MKKKKCKICGSKDLVKGRRICRQCNNARVSRHYHKKMKENPRWRNFKHDCALCGAVFETTSKDSLYCKICRRSSIPGTYEYSKVGIGRLVWRHREIAEDTLGRRLNYNEVVHHIDLDKRNNKLTNLIIINNALHSKLHAYLNRSRAAMKKLIDSNTENCWETLITQWTTAWLETTVARVIKLSEIGQSAAEPLATGEGSETMHGRAVTDDAVAQDIVQTTTERDQETDSSMRI